MNLLVLEMYQKKNKDLWNSFRDATRMFNKQKNNFYKNLKSLEKKSVESKEKTY